MKFTTVPTSRIRRARRSFAGVDCADAAGFFSRLVEFGNGGFDMWLKDSRGNWYMAGQELIGGVCAAAGSWEKDTEGGWIFVSAPVNSLAGAKGNMHSPVHSMVAL